MKMSLELECCISRQLVAFQCDVELFTSLSIGLGSIYLVGSEEGPIYKCDRSYSEQYVMIYTGHNGPVYQVRHLLYIYNS